MAQDSHGRKPVFLVDRQAAPAIGYALLEGAEPPSQGRMEIGKAEDWDQVAATIGDYADETHGQDMEGWNNYTQRRVMSVDTMLREWGIKEPKKWCLRDNNSIEHNTGFYVLLP